MGKPTKPSHVKVSELKDVLANLQTLQEDLSRPRPGGWDSIGQTIEGDLKQGDKGLQENAATVAGNRYDDNVFYINNGWTEIKKGVDTLVTLLQTTINKHTGTDTAVADRAGQTNTTQTPTAPAQKG